MAYGKPGKVDPVSVNGQDVVAVQKNRRGDLEAFKLADGTVLSYNEVMQAALDGQTRGMLIQNNREGEPTLRSFPDGDPSNNLDNLPTFE